VAEQEFYSFDEALKQLRLKEEELKRLVSEGEIRAFREGGTMKLRRTDVESLRTELSGGEVVDMGEVKEELVFEDDVQEEAGMATQEISDVETILDEPVVEVSEVAPEISIEEIAPEVEGEVEGGVEGEAESEEAEAAPARASRSSPRAAPEVELPAEPMLIRVAVLLTVLLLLLALPLCLSASTGVPSGVAGAIAGLFAKSAAP
jgi:excisionase family DNA binding protein